MTTKTEQKLDQIIEMLSTINVANAVRDTERAEIKRDVESLKKTVDGNNGNPGLKISVSVLQEQMGRVITANYAVIGVVGIQVAGIITLLLTHSLPGWSP